jgi:hypothetical protein
MGDSGQLSMRAFSIALVTTIAISFLTPSINAQSATTSSSIDPRETSVSISAALGKVPNPSSWMQLAKLTESDGATYDWFGTSVAISGSTVVVEPGGYVSNRAVYVFEKPSTGWGDMTQTAELTPSVGHLYGSVAIDGNTIIAGGSGGSEDYGAVYVYVKPSTGWTNMTETAQLTSSFGQYYPLGNQVAISGNTVLTDSLEGTTVVFVKPSAGWKTVSTADATLIMPYGTASMAVSQNGTVVLGALDENYLEGSAFVFLKPLGGWKGNVTPVAQLVPSDPTFFFGRSVSIDDDGDTVVGGAYNGCEFCDNGAVYVYVRPSRGWVNMTQTAKLKPPDNLALGTSVAIAGTGERIVAGAPWVNVGTNQFQGIVYMFRKPVNGWKSTKKFSSELAASDGAPNDQLGAAVGICGDAIVAGAPYAMIGSNSQQGAAYVFGKP